MAQVCPAGFSEGCCPSPCPPNGCSLPCLVSYCPTPNDPCCPPMCPPKRCKSRELRGGVLLTNCECVKRNGLQYDCLKSECQGRPLCTTKPIPSCCPSKYTWRYTNVTMGKPEYPVRVGRKGCPKKPDCCNTSLDPFDLMCGL